MYVDAVTGTKSWGDRGEPSDSWVSLANGEVVATAGVGRRLGASAVDLLIPVAGACVVSLVLLIIHIPQFIKYDFGFVGSEWLTNLKSMLWGVWVAFPGLAAWYAACRTSKCGQSWGERASRIETVRVVDGRAPELPQALTRSLLPICVVAIAVSAMLIARPPRSVLTVLLIGGACWLIAQLSTIRSRLGQGWHDIAAQTVTIRMRQVSPAETGQGGPK